MVTYFNKKDLVEFGEYLLSEERKEMLITPDSEKRVSHADVDNFLDKKRKPPVVTFCSQEFENNTIVKVLKNNSSTF